MARTQILVPGWGNGVEQGFWRFFADGLNLISSVAQAGAQSSKRNKRLIVVAVQDNYYILASYSKLC